MAGAGEARSRATWGGIATGGDAAMLGGPAASRCWADAARLGRQRQCRVRRSQATHDGRNHWYVHSLYGVVVYCRRSIQLTTTSPMSSECLPWCSLHAKVFAYGTSSS
jgi:hypothetical protein